MSAPMAYTMQRVPRIGRDMIIRRSAGRRVRVYANFKAARDMTDVFGAPFDCRLLIVELPTMCLRSDVFATKSHNAFSCEAGSADTVAGAIGLRPIFIFLPIMRHSLKVRKRKSRQRWTRVVGEYHSIWLVGTSLSEMILNYAVCMVF